MTEQAARLLRPGIKTVEQLKQELVAMFGTDETITITSPVKLEPPNDGTNPLTITQPYTPFGVPTDPIVIKDGDDLAPFVPPAPPGPPPPPPPPGVPPSPPSSGNMYVAVVGSGSGQNYACTITGPDGVSFDGNVRMPALGSTARLPNGIPVPVAKIGDLYYGFPSVFYGPT